MKKRKIRNYGLVLFMGILLMGLPAAADETLSVSVDGTDEEESEQILWQQDWEYADFSMIHSDAAVLYHSQAAETKHIVVGVNAGHGTSGGGNVQTYSHPDKTPKVTGGTNAAGAVMSTAVSSGMTFYDGTWEAQVTLQMALLLKERLLEEGYDVLMLRTGEDVQLDNVARTVFCNQNADCHIALHWDGDGLSYDKGCYYCSVPDGIKYMEPVASTWQEDVRLGECLIGGLSAQGISLYGNGSMEMDLTQTSYSSVPSVDIELGNAASDHSDERLARLAEGLAEGINVFFEAQDEETEIPAETSPEIETE